MANLEDYKMGADASACALLHEFENIRNFVRACENILIPINEEDHSCLQYEAIQNVLSMLYILDDELSFCDGVAENVYPKVLNMEEERRQAFIGKEQNNEH